jgi:hypothetical protein
VHVLLALGGFASGFVAGTKVSCWSFLPLEDDSVDVEESAVEA